MGWTRRMLCVTALALGSAGAAADTPVVVELFTSQGCSACPPADQLLAHLAEQDGIIALSLHVDYWDYLGWRDGLALPAFTKRQKSYARAAKEIAIFTPQMVVGGVHSVAGFQPMELADLIRRHRQAPSPVTLTLDRDGSRVWIDVAAEEPVGETLVHLVRYDPEVEVEIASGENAGRTMRYANVVTEWHVLGRWSGSGSARLDGVAPGGQAVVVLVQKAPQGEILAARRLR